MENEPLTQEEITVNLNIIDQLKKLLPDTIQNLTLLVKYEQKFNLNNVYQRKLSTSLMGGYIQRELTNKDSSHNSNIDIDLNNCIDNMNALLIDQEHGNQSNYIYWFSTTITDSLTYLNRFIAGLDAKYEPLNSEQLNKVSKIIQSIEHNMISIAEVTS